MNPSVCNLPLYQYTDYVESTFVLCDVNGNPIDISGCSAQMMIRNAPTDPAPLLSISTTATASGVIVLGGTSGSITPRIYRAAYAAGLLTGQQRYDLFLTWPSGLVDDVLTGLAIISPTTVH